jgi:hypothetical protein
MRPAKYFYDNPLPKYLDPKTVLIYCPHPVYEENLIFFLISAGRFVLGVLTTAAAGVSVLKQEHVTVFFQLLKY